METRWDGRLVLVATRAQMAAMGARFDLTWFIPAVVKYRRLFGEVLLASFFLQLFALVSPLFFQVITDKVLVHRAMTSLDVLIFALIVISVFEVILGFLRTYIFSHTTNRVDVELGARLFCCDPRGFVQRMLESVALEETDDEAIEVHGRADHRDLAGA